MERTFLHFVGISLCLFLVYRSSGQIRPRPRRVQSTVEVTAETLKSSGQLKPETINQIQLLLDEKAHRTPAQQKMDSHLIQAAKEFKGQQLVAGVDLEPEDVNADANGQLKVDIAGDITDDLLEKIKSLGGEIIFPSKEYHTVRATVNLADVETIAAFPEIKFIQPAVGARVMGAKRGPLMGGRTINNPLAQQQRSVTRQLLPQQIEKIKKQIDKYVMTLGTGTVNSQGDTALHATDTRNTYGYMGQGIKIGVLSDSYNAKAGAPAAVTSGDLPGATNPLGNTTAVTVLQDYSGGEDEGQAMLQVIHDISPKAQLYFATADISEAGFASNIIALRNAGCDIIIDDVGYYDEQPFQDGIVAQAVNTVTAAGALYFSAAGNEGSVLYNSYGVYEGDFNPIATTGISGTQLTKAGFVHNFGTAAVPLVGDSVVAYYSTNTYTLTWADPIGKSTNDYDLFLVDGNGLIKKFSTNIQAGATDPYEHFARSKVISATNGSRLVVFKTTAAANVAFQLNLQGDIPLKGTNGQSHGHNCAADAYCVAAAPAGASYATTYSFTDATSYPGPYPNAYSAANHLEDFSSDGPRKIFFNPDGTAAVSGSLFTFADKKYVTRLKPDITASDGTSTTLPLLGGLNPFFGTSCAAPHAGAVAALIKSANPSLTPAQIRTILINTALDIEIPGYDSTSGYGIVQPLAAMATVNPTPLAAVAFKSVALGNGTTSADKIMYINLGNLSKVGATNITATISTNTTGVTITQASSAYPDMAVNNTAHNTLPFKFAFVSPVTTSTVITFFVTVSLTGGTSPQGFVVTATPGSSTVLPITFGSITATASNCKASINWETLSEFNSKNFTVEHSYDGVNFSTLGTVAAKGYSETLQRYSLTDASPINGTNYYRIKEMDLDGKSVYSGIVVVANSCGTTSVVAYPNPVKSSFTVILPPATTKQTITIVDALGHQLIQQAGKSGANIINASLWVKGMYSLTVTKDDATIFTWKVIKE